MLRYEKGKIQRISKIIISLLCIVFIYLSIREIMKYYAISLSEELEQNMNTILENKMDEITDVIVDEIINKGVKIYG